MLISLAVQNPAKLMTEYSTVAAVDLGSNSFKLQVARVVENQLYSLDALKEPVRLAAGLDHKKNLTPESRQLALDCLKRFGDRLRGLPRAAVRCVGTSALRQAKNGNEFLAQAEAALGFPIEIIAGREEARLIYLGVVHSLPQFSGRRLVVDIGGGSTECIAGQGMAAQLMESLNMGCVNFSQRFFADGRLDKMAFDLAVLAARNEASAVAMDFHGRWDAAIGSSGTARAIADVLEFNGLAAGGITAAGMERVKQLLIRAGSMEKVQLAGLRADRKPVFAGGLAIMLGVFAELGVSAMQTGEGALREGILYDLLGRFHEADMREATVQEFLRRYHVDLRQAERVTSVAEQFFDHIAPGIQADVKEAHRFLQWAALLHETGISVAHSGYHKHGAYILQNADMPGFSRRDQARLALLVRAQRGGLAKIPGFQQDGAAAVDADDRLLVQCLRLAVAFCRSRRAPEIPADFRLECGAKGCKLSLEAGWLGEHPLAQTALAEEAEDWEGSGFSFRLKAA